MFIVGGADFLVALGGTHVVVRLEEAPGMGRGHRWLGWGEGLPILMHA